MARPPAIEQETDVRIVLNVRSVGLTDDQFFRLCIDNRDLRIEMTARPGHKPERIEHPTILSGDPVLPGFTLDFREIL